MRTSSAKAKGRRAAEEVKELLLKHAPDLHPDDILVTSSSVSGKDLTLSPKAKQVYHFVVEVKNQEAIRLYEALAQAEDHAKKEDGVPVLFFRRNRSKLFAALPAEDFIKLVR